MKPSATDGSVTAVTVSAVLGADAFTPAHLTDNLTSSDSGESGSLWLDVWRDVWRNPSAAGGLIVIILLALFCQFGDVFWRVNPSSMDITQISQAPSFGLQTRVIPDEPSPAPYPLPVVQTLQTIGEPNTESVRLVWPAAAPDPSHQLSSPHYRIYRHELPPSGWMDLGMPLMDTQQTYYEDLLRLESRTYYYSVAVIDNQGKISNVASIPVEVAHATRISALRERGLIDAHSASQNDAIPQTVTLPSHPLGTDKLGRDILARLIKGGQVSLFIGFFAPLLFVLYGTLYGALSGYFGGRIDTLMMANADFVIALPFLLFMILLRIAFGLTAADSGVSALLFALVILSWPSTARLVRGQVLQLRTAPYVDAARLQGASGFTIVWRHMLPNVFPSILVTLSFAIPSAIFTEAFLSFIGLGVVPPTPSWGSMCNDGLASFLTHPHELLFPALFISMTVLAFNLFGDGLRSALDVQARDRKEAG